LTNFYDKNTFFDLLPHEPGSADPVPEFWTVWNGIGREKWKEWKGREGIEGGKRRGKVAK